VILVHKLVKEYLDKVAKEEKEEREQLLIDEGLYEDVYTKAKKASDEFPLCDDEGRYYRREVVDVTDEEYELILKAKQKSKSKTNGIVITLNIIGWFNAIIFAIVSMIIASASSDYAASMFITCVITGFISTTFIFAFSKIISLLQEIVNLSDK
jgi:hypothetical protein